MSVQYEAWESQVPDLITASPVLQGKEEKHTPVKTQGCISTSSDPRRSLPCDCAPYGSVSITNLVVKCPDFPTSLCFLSSLQHPLPSILSLSSSFNGGEKKKKVLHLHENVRENKAVRHHGHFGAHAPQSCRFRARCESVAYCAALGNHHHPREKPTSVTNSVIRHRGSGRTFPPCVRYRRVGFSLRGRRKTYLFPKQKALKTHEGQEGRGDGQAHHLCSGGNTREKKTWELSWILISTAVMWEGVAFGMRCCISMQTFFAPKVF